LKPSNILIDGTGKPLITDFGLAKTTLDGAEDRQLTLTGEIIGTPAYMSPELALGRSQQAGPATDIYSLGTMLYEMLAGRPPFRGDSPLDTISQIRDSEPTPLRQLVPSLPRDLETIVTKCLAKKPDERYETAQALADDLRRFIDGKPILAKPHSRLVHISRWCRRRPTLTALIAACTLFPMLLAVGGWLFAWQQSKLRTEAEVAREKAQQAAFETYDMTQFLLHNALISDNDDPAKRWEEMDARVTEALKRLDHPERKKQGVSHILAAVTRLYISYSAPTDRLVELGERTILVHESEKGPDSFETSSYRLLLGGIYRSAGDYARATTQLERAKASFARLLGVEDSGYLEACRLLEGVESLRGKKVTPLSAGEGEPTKLNSIVYRLDEIERIRDEVEPSKIIREVRELIDKLVEIAPPTSHWIFRARVLLAGVLRRNGDYDEAERVYLETIESVTAIYGPNHGDRLLVMNNLSWTYAEQGRLEEAVAMVKEVYETRKTHDGMDSPTTINSLNNLGMSYKHLGDYEQALVCHDSALEHSIRTLGASSPQSIWLAICRADALTEVGRFEAAIRGLEAILKLAEESLGDGHLKTNQARLELADAYGEKDEWDKSVEMGEKAVHLIQENADGVTLKYLRATMTLGQIYQSAGRAEDCVALLQKTEQELAIRYEEDHALRLMCQTILGRAKFDAGEWEDASKFFEAVTRNEKQTAPNDVPARVSEFLLGVSLLNTARSDSAMTHLNGTFDRLTESCDKYPPRRRMHLARMIESSMERLRESDIPIERWERICAKLNGE
jgi:tetratricopeptide (TPR) repeat protein